MIVCIMAVLTEVVIWVVKFNRNVRNVNVTVA